MSSNYMASQVIFIPPNGSCIDELTEIIPLENQTEPFNQNESPDTMIEINDNISTELRDFVAMVASTYRKNQFHNFEHACHVTMSVNKLLNCVVRNDHSNDLDNRNGDEYQFIHGINSDPLAIFAIVFSALIHGKSMSYCAFVNFLRLSNDN